MMRHCVEWDMHELKRCCVAAIQQLKRFSPKEVRRETAWIQMDHSGLSSQLQTIQQMAATEIKKPFPNLLRHLQEQTHLKKRTIVEILLASQRLDEFETDPRAFIEAVTTVINQEKRRLIRDGVQYERMDEGRCYRQTLFDYQTLIAELRSCGMDVGDREALVPLLSEHFKERQNFGETQEGKIHFYSKLPSSFRIDTPLGEYQPTWALHIQREDQEKWYLGMGEIS
jgi:type III restriction enzyme